VLSRRFPSLEFSAVHDNPGHLDRKSSGVEVEQVSPTTQIEQKEGL